LTSSSVPTVLTSDPTAHATYTLSLHDALPISVAATFLEFWADHSALMAVIDLVALQGDPRFRDVRTEVVSPFTLAAAEVIRSQQDRKSTRLNSSHVKISYAVFCLKKNNRFMGI